MWKESFCPSRVTTRRCGQRGSRPQLPRPRSQPSRLRSQPSRRAPREVLENTTAAEGVSTGEQQWSTDYATVTQAESTAETASVFCRGAAQNDAEAAFSSFQARHKDARALITQQSGPQSRVRARYDRRRGNCSPRRRAGRRAIRDRAAR